MRAVQRFSRLYLYMLVIQLFCSHTEVVAQVPADNAWSTNFSVPGVFGDVRSLMKVGDTVYVGGAYDGVGSSEPIYNIAIYDLTDRTWHKMGGSLEGTSSRVNAIERRFATGTIFAGGKFTKSGSTTLSNIARWDGSNWTPLDTIAGDVNNEVKAIAIRGDSIIVGGSFTMAGGIPVVGLAGWSEATGWFAIGSLAGIGASVETMAVRGTFALYVGGSFTSIDGVPAENIAWYDFTSQEWSPIAQGGVNGRVRSITYAQRNVTSSMFVGGLFSTAGGQTVNNIAELRFADGGKWYPLVDDSTGEIGLDSTVYHVNWNRGGSAVLVGGLFTNAGRDSADHFAVWRDGFYTGFVEVFSQDGPPEADGPVLASAAGYYYTDTLILGGNYEFMYGNYHRSFSLLFGYDWQPTAHGIYDRSSAFHVGALDFASKDRGYIGGSFELAGEAVANGIARWGNNRFWPLGDGVGSSAVSDLVVAYGRYGHPEEDTVWVTGPFSTGDGTGVGEHVQVWYDSAWHPMGLGIDANGYTIERDTSGNVYVGGFINSAGGQPLRGFAMWDGSTWGPLGDTISFSKGSPVVFDIVHDKTSNYLYICGQFDRIGDLPTGSGIAYWDGSNWHALGQTKPGNYGTSRALGIGPNGDIYVGQVTGTLHQWDGADWPVVGGTGKIQGEIYEIQVVGCDVYVVGGLIRVGDPSYIVHNIVRWDGAGWYDFGSGLTGGTRAMALEVLPSNNENVVYAGGLFTKAGLKPSSRLARYDDRSSYADISWTWPSRYNPDTLKYGETVVFGWPADAGLATISLAYSTDAKASWNTAVSNYSASRGALVWEIPPGIDSDSVYFRLSGGAGCLTGDFGPYRVRHVSGLNVVNIYRQYPDGYKTAFDPRVHGFTFGNSATPMWPQSYIDAINYDNLPPTTSAILNHWNNGNDQFQDWFLFVKTWGAATCYYDGGEPRMDVVSLWSSKQKDWRGSCYGFTVNAQSFFDYNENWWNVAEKFQGQRYVHEVPIAAGSRDLVNSFQERQRTARYRKHQSNYWNTDPVEALDSLLTLMGLDGQGANGVHPLLIIKKWSIDTTEAEDILLRGYDAISVDTGVTGGHAMFPYRVTNDPDNPTITRIYVYDPNRPGNTNSVVLVSSFDSTWYYEPLGWGYTKGMIPGPRWQSAHSAQLERALVNGPDDMNSSWINDTLYITLYTSEWNDIMITTTAGDTLGQAYGGGGLIRTSDFGIPIIDEGPLYEYKRPDGYFFPDSTVEITLSGFDSSFTELTWTAEDVFYSFERSDVGPAETDRLQMNGSWIYTNPDPGTKSIAMRAVGVDSAFSWVIDLREMAVGAGDSIALQVASDSLRITNSGGAKTTVLYAAASGSGFTAEVQSESLELPSGSGVTLTADWPNLHQSVLLALIDYTRDGTYDDTLILNVPTSVDDRSDNALPTDYQLAQNYPNPFNPTTTISYNLPQRAFVEIEIYNMLGRTVTTLISREQPPGRHQITWDGRDGNGRALPSGAYFYRLRAGQYTDTRKMLLLK